MRFYFNILFTLAFSQLVFAQNDNSKYPDLVVESYYSSYFDVLDSLYGGQGLNYPILMDVNKILGENKDKWFVSLPKESYIILQYTDNEIVDVLNQNDIQVVEHGCCDEWAEIWVSNSGNKFEFLGLVDDCNQTQLDLADINFKASVRFVKVVGVDVNCASPGFDLVSVYGIGEANQNLYMNMNQVDAYFDEDKNDKILILENVYFDTDQYQILPKGQKDLDQVISKLNEHPEINVNIAGHTDAVASEEYNLILSQNRANAVKAYLMQNGISGERITTKGYGESKPLHPNTTQSGRALNRRVELRRKN